MIEIRHYVSPAGRDVFDDWLSKLGDRRTEEKIFARLDRLANGNFGDCKPVGSGIWELRIDWEPGYRVYYAIIGKELVLLLLGGDKRKQAADIQRASAYLREYRERDPQT
jgi:putative addiction module killer protein